MDAPTYYRHRNEDTFLPEIVVRSWVPGEGDRWGFTVTDVDAAFESWVTVHVHTGQAAAYTAFQAFFEAFAERRPGTLEAVAALLDELGVVDDTAGHERRRALANTAWRAEDDSWPYL
ncbi:hypothetical protein ACIBQ1_09690 [Nonomuraea sp. NPDC050153]|uniref:hypothetical protein n=1 Tax=Nonomuraea sp. NPDC050153 TaxID=3364359 RepID=UPI00378AD8B9